MQRKKIKVGEKYAVVKRMGRDAHESKSVPATVEEMGVEYTTSRWGSFRSVNVTMNDGIRVRFDEPVVVGHYDFKPLSYYTDPERGIKERVVEEHRKNAVTEYVLEGSRYILRPWAEVEEMRARWDRENRERAEKVDAIGQVVEPVYAAVTDRLKDYEHGTKQYTAKGVHGKRITDATFTFDLDEMAALLGVSVEA